MGVGALMSVSYAFALLLQSSEDGLTWQEIVDSIPTDPASVFAIVLVLACVSLVVWFGRPGGGNGRKKSKKSP
jgi:hypothetical protein